MDKKVMTKLEEGFCEVLHRLTRSDKGFQSANDVETAKAALSGLVKMKMLEEMEDYEGGMSGRAYYDEGGMSSRGSYRRDSHGRYADSGMSYRRHYDGGFDDGYSGHDMRQQLERMAEEADSERERQVIRAALQKL